MAIITLDILDDYGQLIEFRQKNVSQKTAGKIQVLVNDMLTELEEEEEDQVG